MPKTPAVWKAATQANTSDGNEAQFDPQVVGLADGGYVVVWTDASGQFNANDTAIVAQKYDAFGYKVGNEVEISSVDTADQSSPAVTLLANGRIAVAFVDESTGAGDIHVRVFNADLGFVREDVIENTATAAANPSITAFADSSYLVSYTLGTGNGAEIYARKVSSNGQMLNPASDVLGRLSNDDHSQVATLSNGKIVVVGQSENPLDPSNHDIQFAIYNPDDLGTFVISPANVAGGGSVFDELDPDVAALPGAGFIGGRFVVVWTDADGDNSGSCIRASIYGDSGAPIKADFLVNTSTTGDQREAHVLTLADGGFLVTWEDGGTADVHAQRFDYSGTKVGVEFLVKEGTSQLSSPEAALLADGRIVFGLDHLSIGLPPDHDVVASIFDPRTAKTILGTAAADKLTSLSSGGTVKGLDGNDILFGVNGKDVLKGGANDDKLTGGLNKDTLFGGTGQDTFDFNLVEESRIGAKKRDIIKDFHRAEHDVIDLKDIDANTNVGGNQGFVFIGKQSFHHQAGELRYAKKDGFVVVMGDVDGNGKADFHIQVDGVGNLLATDFLLT